MKKELYFEEDWKNNLEFYTFDLNVLNSTLAKLASIIEEKEYVPVTFKSKEFDRTPEEENGKRVFKPRFNFAHVVVAKEHENKDFMDYYRGQSSGLFSISSYVKKHIGFVLHEEKFKLEISKNAKFSKHDVKLKITNPETEVFRDRKIVRIGEYFDHNTRRINAIDEHYHYVIDFLNFVINKRLSNKVTDLSSELMDDYLKEFISLYLIETREDKIENYQNQIDILKEKIKQLKELQQHYDNLNKPKVRTREQ